MPRPRWLLIAQARMWRGLMEIGMFLHRIAPPCPPKPSFSRRIPTTVSPQKGEVNVEFYVPEEYNRDETYSVRKKYPVVVNFHGGGFTLGRATDDARWADTVVRETGAIVASVDYRRAPEYPFPTAVEDGVDALIYLVKHAAALRIDTSNIAVSGFSCGGNMAFTVPLRLQEEVSADFEPPAGAPQPAKPASATLPAPTTIVRAVREVRIKALVAWYPSTDYTVTREQRRATNLRKDQELSATFTQLFDESYLQPPTLDMTNPYLSPGVAPEWMLQQGLPRHIVLYTCEWDMLRTEAERFKARLEGAGKEVRYTMVAERPHGWDKAPNPFRQDPNVMEHYLQACKELRKIFAAAEEEEEEEEGEMSMGSGMMTA